MLDTFLTRNRAPVVAEWFDRIVAGYPPETADFLRRQADPFANPVGEALREELGRLFDGVVGGLDRERLVASLDRLLRVRAVQDFAPSAAVGFLIDLKRIIRDRVAAAGIDGGQSLAALEARIDDLLLAAFDVYSACREQVFSIRVKEIRALAVSRMERLNAWRARREGVGGSDAVEPH